MNRLTWFIGIALAITAGFMLAHGIATLHQVEAVTPIDQAEFAPFDQTRSTSIVFLTAPTEDAAQLSRFTTPLNAALVHTWEDVVRADQQTRLDGLIIHASAADLVDRAWLAQRYWNRLVVAGIDLNGMQMAALINDHCLSRDGFADYTAGSYFVVASRAVEGAPADVSRIMEAYNRSCGDQAAEGVVGAASSYVGYTTEYLIDEHHFAMFTQIFNRHIENVNLGGG